MTLRFYSAGEVHAALDWERLADALAAAFAAGAHVPLRHAHPLSEPDTLLLMPAWRDSGDGGLGVKIVTVMPGNAARGAATVNALYLLLDRASGEPRAVIDGEALTLRRTAAASALAARYLARPDATNLLVIGTGKLAPFMARAHCALRPALMRVRIWGRRAEAAQTLAQLLRDEGLPAEAAGDLEAAVRDAHIVSCATTATAPIVHGAWLAPGTHVDLVGGFTREMREADDTAVACARIFVDTYAGALAEAGDLVAPIERGVIALAQVEAELAELVRGQVQGRRTDDEITLFK
ncbi:MAG: ornithine cyclodeaminase family protein, partial [Burkholderiaceae bacterium]|nr:ornithine cyclodeaminase family protein [Burkholderiaceae bacterium]